MYYYILKCIYKIQTQIIKNPLLKVIIKDYNSLTMVNNIYYKYYKNIKSV